MESPRRISRVLRGTGGGVEGGVIVIVQRRRTLPLFIVGTRQKKRNCAEEKIEKIIVQQ